MAQKYIRMAFAALLFNVLTVMAFAQDFQKSYSLAEGNQVGIKNVAGDILVKGSDRADIVITAFKEGRDKNLLTIEDFSSDSRVDIRVKYPQNCNCEASIRFEVQVPRSVSYNYDAFSTAAGNLKMEDLRGSLRADNLSGYIWLRNVAGPLYASSYSGDVTVEQAVETPTRANGRWRRGYQRYLPGTQSVGAILATSLSGTVRVMLVQLDGSSTGRMEFSSVSGSVEVKMPTSLGAQVEMTTMVGKVETDFSLTVVNSGIGLGGSARGRIGDGSRLLRINSTAGNVSLRKN